MRLSSFSGLFHLIITYALQINEALHLPYESKGDSIQLEKHRESNQISSTLLVSHFIYSMRPASVWVCVWCTIHSPKKENHGVKPYKLEHFEYNSYELGKVAPNILSFSLLFFGYSSSSFFLFACWKELWRCTLQGLCHVRFVVWFWRDFRFYSTFKFCFSCIRFRFLPELRRNSVFELTL